MQTTILRIIIVLISYSIALHADEAKDLQKHLQDRFLNKIFMVRNFYGGDHLVYDSQGNLLEGDRSVYQGCWSGAQIEIHKLEINKGRLILRGPRVLGIFNLETKELSQLGREPQEVQIEIQLDPAQMNEDSLTGVLTKIFLTRQDNLWTLTPYVWTASTSTAAQGGDATQHGPGATFRVGNGVTAPKPIYTPDPEYSERARKAKYQGYDVLWFEVDEKGNVARIRVYQCLGLGLDEQAIRALSKWKFEPATKDSRPVSVEMNVTMNFHLY